MKELSHVGAGEITTNALGDPGLDPKKRTLLGKLVKLNMVSISLIDLGQ